MTWGRMDDKFHRNRKVRQLRLMSGGREALGVWVFWWSWCLDDPELSGVVPASELSAADAQAAELLVTVGLWERVEEGFVFHDFHAYNPNRAQVDAKRAADRERVAAKRNASRANVARDTAATNPRVASRARVPTQPILDPSPTLPAEGSGGLAWSEGEIPPDVAEAVRVSSGTDAAEFANAVLAELDERGWGIDREVPVDDRGDGQAGRLDAVVRRGTEVVALEFDRRTPRAKSVAKLQRYTLATGRAVAVRERVPNGASPELLRAAVAQEAVERGCVPAPTIESRDAFRAAERAAELVRGELFADPATATQALVHAAFDLWLGPQQRPLRFALLEATVTRVNGRSRSQENHVPPEDPWV